MLRHANEYSRGNIRGTARLPAQQRFGTHAAASADLDLRLIVDRQLVEAYGMDQLAFDLAVRVPGVAAVLGAEDVIAVFAIGGHAPPNITPGYHLLGITRLLPA